MDRVCRWLSTCIIQAYDLGRKELNGIMRHIAPHDPALKHKPFVQRSVVHTSVSKKYSMQMLLILLITLLLFMVLESPIALAATGGHSQRLLVIPQRATPTFLFAASTSSQRFNSRRMASASFRAPTDEDKTSDEDEDINDITVPPDIQKIIDRGVLMVALLDTDNPPFFMTDEGDRLDGLDIAIARDLAEKLGVDLEFNRSATTFNEVVDTVFNREADIAISKISRTMSRIQRVRFSEPYLRMRQGLLVNRLRLAQHTQGRSVPEAVRDLQGEVGVIEGSSYVGFLQQKFPDATIVEYPDWNTIVEAVTDGEVLAAYRDELEIKKIVRTNPNAALGMQTIALTDTEDPIAMVLPWNSTHLLAFVNQYLDTERLDYSADKVLQDYSQYFDSN